MQALSEGFEASVLARVDKDSSRGLFTTSLRFHLPLRRGEEEGDRFRRMGERRIWGSVYNFGDSFMWRP